MNFTTANGEKVTGDRLLKALDRVACKIETQAHLLREEDPYASHVPEGVKDDRLAADLKLAQAVRGGEVKSFTIWQRVNYELTGESVPLFSAPFPLR